VEMMMTAAAAAAAAHGMSLPAKILKKYVIF
jgi:hypothetical protein